MTQFRSPLIWRLTLWFLLLSLIPVGIVLVFVQRQVRSTIVDQQIQSLSDQASLLSRLITSQPENTQALIDEFGVEDQIAFLLGADGTYIAHSISNKVGNAANLDIRADILQQLLNEPKTKIDDSGEGQYYGSAKIEKSEYVVVISANSDPKTKSIDDLSRGIIVQLSVSLLITSLAGGVAIVVVLNPIVRLSNFADRLAAGELEAEFDTSELEGEVSTLAQSLNNLAVRIREAISTLEQRVEERTLELKERAIQLQTIAEVSRSITSIQNLDNLLTEVTVLISQRFGIYHTGIFLIDEHKEFAILRASNSQGGQIMLARGHRLKVGAQGIVGYVTSTGNPRIALDVGEDAVYFNNPDLPETRSEMALPLKIADQVFGALDLQSTQPNAFSEEDVQVLSILADQVAVAIQNVRSFEKTQQAVLDVEAAYRQMTRQSWLQVAARRKVLGYEYDGETPKPITETLPDESSLNIPLILRGQAIGMFKLSSLDPGRAWTEDELALVQVAADRAALALESARLLEDAQRRAAKESTIGQISTKISETAEIERIMQTAVSELRKALGATEVALVIGDEKTN